MTNKNIHISIVLALVLVAGGWYLATSQGENQPGANTVLAANQVIYDSIPTQAGKINFRKQSVNLTKEVDPELVDLDKQIITCSPGVDDLLSPSPSYDMSCVAGGGTLASTDGLYLGGQCCGATMDTHAYKENLEKLQEYKDMEDIILDPMRTPIDLAKKWIDYNDATTLTNTEQSIYDEAMKVSSEGPCCCKCWHYFVNEGIAKKMIKDGTHTAEQIAGYWDASSICGGESHGVHT